MALFEVDLLHVFQHHHEDIYPQNGDFYRILDEDVPNVSVTSAAGFLEIKH